MGRPKGTKNRMLAPEVKERLVLEYIEQGVAAPIITEREGIDRSNFKLWVRRYRLGGLPALESQTGKKSIGKKKKSMTEIDQLKLENLKLKIEIERLKKGYSVKGAGTKKEYVSIKDPNMK